MKKNNYKIFFGFNKEPFSQELSVKEMLQTKSMLGVKERLLYAIELGAAAVITGDIGSGKSTALRFAMSTLHPAEYQLLHIVSTSGSIAELYKQICAALAIEIKTSSKALLTQLIRSAIVELNQTKQKPVLIIDEASLLRVEVLAELHTITQFFGDSKPILPIIMAGQNNLIDNLMFRQSKALASRVVARSHMEPLDEQELKGYLDHHLNIAGCRVNLFLEQAVTAIFQASGGILRKTNNLARGALISAASDKQSVVSADHVRIASSELF